MYTLNMDNFTVYSTFTDISVFHSLYRNTRIQVLYGIRSILVCEYTFVCEIYSFYKL